MPLIRRKIFSLLLALAWVAMPLAHAASHLAELQQQPALLAPSGQLNVQAAPAAAAPDCELCHSLIQAKGLAPVQPAMALAPSLPSAALAASRAIPRSSSFTYFDHRGPPVQA